MSGPGLDWVAISAKATLAANISLFDDLTADYADLCVRNPNGAPEFVFFDGERVLGIEAAALRAQQHVGNVLRVVTGQSIERTAVPA